MTRTAQRILTKAADLLEEVGWCQNTAAVISAKGKPIAYCAVGAIGAAAYSLRCAGYFYHDAINASQDVILKEPGPNLLSRWNDTKGRTAEEVISVLRKAAAKAWTGPL